MRVAQFEDLLGSRVEAVAGRIESSGRQASDGLMARAEELSLGIKSHVEDAERSLTNLVVNTSETIQTGARAAQQSLLTVSSDVGAQLKLTSAEVERALTAVGTGAANSILTSARDAQSTLVTASSEAASQIKSLSADVERTLSAAGRDRDSIVAGAREAQTTLVTASADAATRSSRWPPTSSVRCRSPAVHRIDHSGAREARARWSRFHRCRQPGQVAGRRRRAFAVDGRHFDRRTITAGAREAQSTLVNASADAASQVKSLAADVERSLSIAGTSTAEAVRRRREAQTTLVTASPMPPTTSSRWRATSNAR